MDTAHCHLRVSVHRSVARLFREAVVWFRFEVFSWSGLGDAIYSEHIVPCIVFSWNALNFGRVVREIHLLECRVFDGYGFGLGCAINMNLSGLEVQILPRGFVGLACGGDTRFGL